MALQVALVGTLAARFERIASALSRESWGAETIVLVILMVLYATLLIGVVIVAASVYLPRNPRDGGSLIYFADIAAMPLELFQERSRQMDPETIERQLLDQVHAVSRIANTKMRWVKWAYYLSAPSVVLWIILLAWGSI